MLDFDHQPNPRTIYDALLSCFSSDEIAPASVLALAHITPSGDGLRLVLKREKGKSIEQEQYEWFKRIEKHHEGKLSFDDVCKDISRLSFAPMQKEILYYNPSLLFAELPEASDYPDGSLFSGVKEYRSEGVKTNAAITREQRLLASSAEHRGINKVNVSSADGVLSSLLSKAKKNSYTPSLQH